MTLDELVTVLSQSGRCRITAQQNEPKRMMHPYKNICEKWLCCMERCVPETKDNKLLRLPCCIVLIFCLFSPWQISRWGRLDGCGLRKQHSEAGINMMCSSELYNSLITVWICISYINRRGQNKIKEEDTTLKLHWLWRQEMISHILWK